MNRKISLMSALSGITAPIKSNNLSCYCFRCNDVDFRCFVSPERYLRADVVEVVLHQYNSSTRMRAQSCRARILETALRYKHG